MLKISLILTILVLISCVDKKVYNDEEFKFSKLQYQLLDIFPSGDTLIFSNDTADSIYSVLILDHTFEKFNAKGIATNQRIRKDGTVYFCELQNDTCLAKQPLLSVSTSPENNNYNSISLYWYTNFTYFTYDDTLSPLLENIVLAGKEYQNVYKLEHVNFNSYFSKKIKTIYMTLSNGIIAYESGEGEIWTQTMMVSVFHVH